MGAPRQVRRGFTIVELLVTIGIIAALMGLLLVGLQAARRTSKTTTEKTYLRELHRAWQQYANTYDDAAMPGYIEESVQTNFWKVKYKGSDKKTNVPAEYCQTYPNRIMPYLDHSPKILFEYLEVDDDDYFKPLDSAGNLNTTGLNAMSRSPAFGYNAYYVGGWWRDVGGAATLRFGNATWTDANGVNQIGKVVALKASGVARPSNMIIFCGSAQRDTGYYKSDSEYAEGAAWVTPHILAGTLMWEPWDGTVFEGMQTSGQPSPFSVAQASGGSLQSLFPTLAQATNFALVQSPSGVGLHVAAPGPIGVPFKRFGNQVSVVHADGSTTGAGMGELLDQTRWMNPAGQGADKFTFTHSDTD
jgi:prepilin-type N-terminal cleavage/methylation domain-containing protein